MIMLDTHVAVAMYEGRAGGLSLAALASLALLRVQTVDNPS